MKADLQSTKQKINRDNFFLRQSMAVAIDTKFKAIDTYWYSLFGYWVASRWGRCTWSHCGACRALRSDIRNRSQRLQGWWVLCRLQRWRPSQRGLDPRWRQRMSSHPLRFAPCLTKLGHLCGVQKIFTVVDLSK